MFVLNQDKTRVELLKIAEVRGSNTSDRGLIYINQSIFGTYESIEIAYEQFKMLLNNLEGGATFFKLK